MKKAYTAPEIQFEDFSLSATIAGTCERIVGTQSQGICGIEGTGGIMMFTDQMNACDYTPPTEDQWDGFCYHVPTELHTLFNS